MPVPTELLYKQHLPWLQGWIVKKLGNIADAADLAQDTFLRLLITRPAEINEPRAYLLTIAKGLVINKYKRKLLEQSYIESIAHLPEQETPSPEHCYLIIETLQEIDAMLDALPSIVRDVFLLSQLEGLMYQEIASQLDISLSTVKRYMKQGFLQCLTTMDMA